MTTKGKLVASMVAGLFLVGAPIAAKAGDADKDPAAKGEKASCKGKDGCKGKHAKKDKADKAGAGDKKAE